MNPAVLVAIIAAAAVLLLFFGIFGGRRVSPTERIEQVAVAATEARKRDGGAYQGQVAPRPASSVGTCRGRRGPRRRAARLGCQHGTRAGACGPSAAALRVPRHPGWCRHRRPARDLLLGKTILPSLDNAIALLVAVVLGWWIPRF